MVPARPLPEGKATIATSALATVVTAERGPPGRLEAYIKRKWPEDRVTGAVVNRAASVPATIGTPAWAGVLAAQAVEDTIVGLAPASAAAEKEAANTTEVTILGNTVFKSRSEAQAGMKKIKGLRIELTVP